MHKKVMQRRNGENYSLKVSPFEEGGIGKLTNCICFQVGRTILANDGDRNTVLP